MDSFMRMVVVLCGAALVLSQQQLVHGAGLPSGDAWLLQPDSMPAGNVEYLFSSRDETTLDVVDEQSLHQLTTDTADTAISEMSFGEEPLQTDSSQSVPPPSAVAVHATTDETTLDVVDEQSLQLTTADTAISEMSFGEEPLQQTDGSHNVPPPSAVTVHATAQCAPGTFSSTGLEPCQGMMMA
jgi:hypothetical protein